MAEWRFGRGWTEREIRSRLMALERLEHSYAETDEQLTPERGWNRYRTDGRIGREGPGPVEPGGAFERAWEAVSGYEFSDPSIVKGHFDRAGPLLGRKMLLEIKVLGLRYLSGVAVEAIRRDVKPDRTVYGFRYDTLKGHIERGAEWFVLTKEHSTGEIRFEIEAAWKPGEFPNAWSRLGFLVLGRHYQRKWHRQAYLRLRERIAPHETFEAHQHEVLSEGDSRRSTA